MPRLEWQAYESLLHHAKLCDTDPEYDWDDYPKDRRHALNAVLDLEELKASHKELVEALKNVVDGNDLAFARNHNISTWDESAFRKQAIAALANAEKLTK